MGLRRPPGKIGEAVLQRIPVPAEPVRKVERSSDVLEKGCLPGQRNAGETRTGLARGALQPGGV